METNKCPECKGKIVKKEMSYKLLGIDLGNFPNLVCEECNNQFYEEEILDKIDAVAKRKGLWGLEHRTRLNVLGNSLAVRLSKSQIKFSNLKKGKRFLFILNLKIAS